VIHLDEQPRRAAGGEEAEVGRVEARAEADDLSTTTRRMMTTPNAVVADVGPTAWVKRSVSRTSYRSNVEREARVKSDDGKSP
jgi:hypothetical protein